MKINIPAIIIGFVMVLTFCMNAFADTYVRTPGTVPQRYPQQAPQYQPRSQGQYEPQYRPAQRGQDCNCANNGGYAEVDPVEAFLADPAVRHAIARARSAGYVIDASPEQAFLQSSCGVAGCSETSMVTLAVRPGGVANPQSTSIAAVVTVHPPQIGQYPIVRLINVQALVR